MGYIDDAAKRAHHQKAIPFIFSTIYEGFGVPVLEAMLLVYTIVAKVAIYCF